jgi:hypothetical protein
MERGSLGLFLGLRTPQSPTTHAEAGTVLAHWTGHYTFDISRTSFDACHWSHATSCRTASVQQFLRGRSASNPWTNARARQRDSTRGNRPATRPSSSSRHACQRAGSMSSLWPAATV